MKTYYISGKHIERNYGTWYLIEAINEEDAIARGNIKYPECIFTFAEER